MNVRAAFRRGIGSVTGTTASQFEPFASGYLNTYMLVAGRVGAGDLHGDPRRHGPDFIPVAQGWRRHPWRDQRQLHDSGRARL